MMNCPRCGLSIEDASASACPLCGQSLAETAAASLPDSEVATDALYEAPALPASGLTSLGAGIISGQIFSSYGQGAPATAPTPPAGSAPPAPAPAMPPRKSKSGLIIGILLALVVLLASGLGVSLYALAHQQQSDNKAAAATSTPAPTATATPNETIFFQDPLTSNTNGWASDSHCFFQNGAYHIRDGYLCYAPVGNISDGNIYVDAQQVSGEPLWFYGIVLRRISQGNYYVFDIDSNGKWLFGKVVNDTYTNILPYRPDGAIHKGLNTINTLLVRMKGSQFEFYVNGTLVGQVEDSTFTTGRCGVHGDSHIEAAYNNFKITTSS